MLLSLVPVDLTWPVTGEAYEKREPRRDAAVTFSVRARWRAAEPDLV